MQSFEGKRSKRHCPQEAMRKTHKKHSVTVEVALALCGALCESTVAQPKLQHFVLFQAISGTS